MIITERRPSLEHYTNAACVQGTNEARRIWPESMQMLTAYCDSTYSTTHDNELVHHRELLAGIRGNTE